MANDHVLSAVLMVADIRPDCTPEALDIVKHLTRGNRVIAEKRAFRLIDDTLRVSGDLMTDDQHDLLASVLPPECTSGPGRQPVTMAAIMWTANMTIKQISDRFNIPYRTVQNWSNGTRVAPQYVLDMMAEILGIK